MGLTLAAGEDLTLPFEGYGFYFISGDGPVFVELREHDGRVDQGDKLLPGQGLRGNDRFEGFRIRNDHTATQTIEFYLGSRDFVDNRDTGVVTLQGKLPAYDTGVKLPDFTNPQSIINDIPVLRTTAYRRRSATTALNTIVTPAENTAGIVLSSVALNSFSGVAVRLSAKTAAPATWDDALALTVASNEDSSTLTTNMEVPMPIKIPAGYGLYERASSAGAATTCAVTYEVLS